MFRRHWSALPRDPVFPSTLGGLGYFINDEDEIRSIENPDKYFRYFINRNDRVNYRQRFHFDLAMQGIILERLEREGLQQIPLPVGTPSSEKHIPVFASPGLETKSRVVLIVGESHQALGMLASRVANGPGGINKGSAVSLVRAIAKSQPDAAIVLANPGSLYWWPEGKSAITLTASEAIPRSSLVSYGLRHIPEVNSVPGHENDREHVASVFREVLGQMAGENAIIDIIAIGDGAVVVEEFLDETKNWEVWGKKLGGMVLMNTQKTVDSLHNEELKSFLAKRARCYATSTQPLGTPIATPAGNSNLDIPPLGLPVFSSSEEWCVELIAITALEPTLAYLKQVASTPGFKNPEIDGADIPMTGEGVRRDPDAWESMDEELRPRIQVVDERLIREQRMWNRFEETGVAEREVEEARDEEMEAEAEAEVEEPCLASPARAA